MSKPQYTRKWEQPVADLSRYAVEPGIPVDARTRDIAADVLAADGRMRVLPASFWASTTAAERALFGARNGIYSFPTAELVEYLAELIGGRPAIEIGAGNGVLSEMLGIRATDSRQQEEPRYRALYARDGQVPVPYGPNVVKSAGNRAVRLYRPQVVLACWVTHKYDRRQHAAGGNEAGVDEAEVIAGCEQYVFVGNEQVHRDKPIWKLPHTIEYPPFVYSRAVNGSRDFVAVWPGGRR